MIQEFRLYYESVEQANHFVLPVVRRALKSLSPSVRIKLVKLRRNYTYYSSRVAPIFFWKEPDVLITVVQDKDEYPLLLIEFSTAVFTEDHELQRFDGMLAAAKNNCVYAKISPTKKESPYEHGGRVEFDYTKPFSLIYRRYGKPYFHFEWKCDENGVVETDPEYLSCPKRIEEFEWLMEAIMGEIIEKGYSERWIYKIGSSLQSKRYYRTWIGKLQETTKVDVTTLDTSRTRWIEKDPVLNVGVLELKLNRFGHAMDPERGMLAYYGTLAPDVVAKMMFSEENDAWYKDTPKEAEISQYIKRNGLARAYDFLYCFALGSGLFRSEEFMGIMERYEQSETRHVILDLTDFIERNILELSKPLRTIFTYSRLFAIEDERGRRKVTFTWQPYEELRIFENYSGITNIVERTTLDEDDVTYVAVHNILRPNGYKIIAVSYPGAQGDRRILVEPRTGRRQPREYIDIISFLPEKVTSLQENQGSYGRRKTQRDIDRLARFKEEPAYTKGLRNFQRRFAPTTVSTIVKIGVGFWAHKSYTISRIKKVDLKGLDYFVYITSDRKHWNIWRTGTDNMFHSTNGEVSIPETYDVVSQNDVSAMKISDFLQNGL